MKKIFALALGFSLLAGGTMLMGQDTKMDSTSTTTKKKHKTKKSTTTSTSAHSAAAN